MSAHQRDRPGRPDPGSPGGAGDVWGGDELDQLLAAPSGTSRLGQVLAAARAPAEAEQLSGEFAARSAFRIAFPAVPTTRSRILARMSGRAAVVTLAGGLVLSGGAAAAAAGALPGAAQQTASNVLAKLGVSVPGADDHAGGHPTRHDPTTRPPAPIAERSAVPVVDEKSGLGGAVSDLARNSATTGVDHGAAVSDLASDGESQADEHGKATSPPTGKATKTPAPHATKRQNGATHKPDAPGAGHSPPRKAGD